MITKIILTNLILFHAFFIYLVATTKSYDDVNEHVKLYGGVWLIITIISVPTLLIYWVFTF